MFIATQDFNSPAQGRKKKGDPVEYNTTWYDAGLIEEATEAKPEPKAKVETKPQKKGKR